MLGSIVGKIDSGIGNVGKVLGYDSLKKMIRKPSTKSFTSWMNAGEHSLTGLGGKELSQAKYDVAKAKVWRHGAVYGAGALGAYTVADSMFDVSGTASSLYNKILP